MVLETGKILNNRYRVVKLLGHGGFGSVYRVWDLNMQRARALKENLDTSPKAQRQFLREAQILDGISHPNLPKVIDHFFIPGQGQYVVMEFIEGMNLKEMLGKNSRALNEDQVLPWIREICDALIYLHNQNPPIIHRDIKPANIRITPQGKAFLVDFGIAKVFDPRMKTTIGARAVTPGYSPHEQYGQGTTDTRSDIYALGATLYTLLTGFEPLESIQRVLNDLMTPPEKINQEISPHIAAVIWQAVQINPANRFQRISDFKSALTAPTPVFSPSPIKTTKISPTEIEIVKPAHQQRIESLKPRWFPISAGITILFLIIVVVILGSKRDQPDLLLKTQTAVVVAQTQTAMAVAALPGKAETPAESITPEVVLTRTESQPPSETSPPTLTLTQTHTPEPSKTNTPLHSSTQTERPQFTLLIRRESSQKRWLYTADDVLLGEILPNSEFVLRLYPGTYKFYISCDIYKNDRCNKFTVDLFSDVVCRYYYKQYGIIDCEPK